MIASLEQQPSPPRIAAKLRERRNLEDLLGRLPKPSLSTGNLFYSPLPGFERCGRAYRIPKYVFIGPPGGESYVRLGLFAAIHGDESAGAEALIELLVSLSKDPQPASGFELIVYPVCNPTGYEDDTRWPREGTDINRDFWRKSSQPEVKLLEEQLWALKFEGLISLHADDTSAGTYGYVGGAVLTKHLLEPALVAAEKFLPRNRTPQIDGWSARDGIIEDAFVGSLEAPTSQHPRPFEIVFETPQLANHESQVQANLAAIFAIFKAYRNLQAHAANI